MTRQAAMLPTGLALPDSVANNVRSDRRRILVIGAGGWIGRTLLALLWQCLGPGEFSRRVVAFGSSARDIELSSTIKVSQQPLETLTDLEPAPSLAFHLAFLTKDKVAGMDRDRYITANRAVSDRVMAGLLSAGVDRLFLASSGAAAFADDASAADDLRLYGQLKREDEQRFADWATDGRRAMICRIYAVSGPYVNKPETYALASFIGAALAGGPVTVKAPRQVFRSYVAVREVLAAALAELLSAEAPPVTLVDSGGAPTELADVAAIVADLFGTTMVRAPISEADSNIYVGDDIAWQKLLHRHGLGSMTLREQIWETAQWLQTH
ncbi:hypothetical protein CAP39_06965 [Sphingomonas sp. IBVSS1]|nr:hypothetical protein CAP39_06965 [Sphingomonas sp. IBVSS1]